MGTENKSGNTPRNRFGKFLQSDAAAGLILAGAALLAILIFNIEALSP